MTNNFRKGIAMLLALVLTLGCVLPVLADDDEFIFVPADSGYTVYDSKGSGTYIKSGSEKKLPDGPYIVGEAMIYKEADTESVVIGTLEAKSEIEVLSNDGVWALVRFGEIEGYVQRGNIENYTEWKAVEEPTEEPTEEAPVEEPTEEPAEEAPVEEPTEEPTEEAPVEEPTEEPSEEAPVEEPTEEPAEEAPVEEPTEEPAEEVPVEEPTEEPTEEPSEESPVEEPTEEPSEEVPVEEPIEEPAEEVPTEEPVVDIEVLEDEEPAEEPTEEPVVDIEVLEDEEPAEEPTEEEPTEEEPSEEEPTEESVEEAELPKPVVTVFTTAHGEMIYGEPVYLTSLIVNDEDYDMTYQWMCDKRDGNGFNPVPGATDSTYTFSATYETLEYLWYLEYNYTPKAR